MELLPPVQLPRQVPVALLVPQLVQRVRLVVPVAQVQHQLAVVQLVLPVLLHLPVQVVQALLVAQQV